MHSVINKNWFNAVFSNNCVWMSSALNNGRSSWIIALPQMCLNSTRYNWSIWLYYVWISLQEFNVVRLWYSFTLKITAALYLISRLTMTVFDSLKLLTLKGQTRILKIFVWTKWQDKNKPGFGMFAIVPFFSFKHLILHTWRMICPVLNTSNKQRSTESMDKAMECSTHSQGDLLLLKAFITFVFLPPACWMSWWISF